MRTIKRLGAVAGTALWLFAGGCSDDTSTQDAGTTDASTQDVSVADGAADSVEDMAADSEPDAVVIPQRPSDLTACDTEVATSPGNIQKVPGAPADDPRLTEVSGMVASRKNADVLWVHDDSGAEANVYAINTDGKLLAIYKLKGVAQADWEDIGIGPGPSPGADYLYIGDIGDKNRDKLSSDIVVYRLPEPTVSSTPPGTVPEEELDTFEAIKADYPTGLVATADALFVDPAASTRPDIYMVSTGNGIDMPNRLFRFKPPVNALDVVTMEYLFDVYGGDSGDPEVTGADISADGKQIVIRSLKSANLWARGASTSIPDAIAARPCDAKIAAGDADTEEGGAITFNASADGYYTTIEADPPPLFWIAFSE